MKKILFIFLSVLLSVSSFSQKRDTVSVVRSKTLTAFGKVIGDSVSRMIDSDGGKISSPDGKMELIIPPNALLSKTNISITPVENLAPGGSIGAYKLEPSEIEFKQPAKIIYHYKDSDYNGSNQNLQSIAFQDKTGQWYRLKKVFIDTAQKTITGDLTHFSVWATFDYAQILPSSARVRVGKTKSLSIVINWPSGGPTNSSSAPGVEDDLASPPPSQLVIVWQVNSVPGGNAVDGTIAGDNSGASYTAPNSIPERNPVAVTAEAEANAPIGNIIFHSLKLVSNITIIDNSYLITVSGYNKQSTLRCTITSLDTGSCILQLNGRRSKLEDIKNMNQKIVVTSCPCNVRELNPGRSVGPINIVGASRIDVVPANPPQKPYASVTIYFTRSTGIIAGFAVDPCQGSPGTSWPAMPFPALPAVLQFEAKPGEQTLMKGGDANNGFEVKVKRLDEDH